MDEKGQNLEFSSNAEDDMEGSQNLGIWLLCSYSHGGALIVVAANNQLILPFLRGALSRKWVYGEGENSGEDDTVAGMDLRCVYQQGWFKVEFLSIPY